MAIVAVAGPLANLAMAILYALPIRLGLVELSVSSEVLPTAFQLCITGVEINLLLFGFNLLPIPPLDGFTILLGILPAELAYQLAPLRRYGSMLLIGALFLLPIIGIDIFSIVIGQVFETLLPVLTGLG
jgi:Zn-dependent protease